MKKSILLVTCLIIGMSIYTTDANAETQYNNLAANTVTFELNPMLANPAVATTQSAKKQAVEQQPTAATKDIMIEGRVEKTQPASLYQGQTPEELQYMLNSIGKRIVAANGMAKSVYFKYSDKEIVNANVNVSNIVTVYKGLIKSCQTEDELAYVIGHELGHANNYHILKQAGVRTAGSIGSNIATNAVAGSNVWAQTGVMLGTQMATKLGESKVSRIHENDADLCSIDYVVKAGYNPLASIAIMNKIGTTYLDVLSDHPSTEKRIIKMYRHIRANYPQYFENGYDSDSYKSAIQIYVENSQYASR